MSWTKMLNRGGEMVISATKEAIKFAGAGMPIASEEVQNSRLNTCKTCEFYIKGENRCGKCGCYLKPKIAMATTSCPLSKWLT